MKILKTLLLSLSLSLIGSFAMASEEFPTRAEVLAQLLDSTNDFFSTYGNCPRTDIATSCGDGVCATGNGETAAMCPQDCNSAPVIGWTKQAFCDEVKAVYEPSSFEEMADIMQEARVKGQKVKILGSRYSMSRIICTDGIVIITTHLNRIHGIEQYQGEQTVLVDGGVTLKALNEWLYDRGLALGYGTIAPYRTTVAGVIGTGSHGGSYKHNAVLSNDVASVEIINSEGDLVEYSDQSKDPNIIKALRAHLGLLGVVTKVRLKVQPTFNLHVEIDTKPEEALFAGEGIRGLVDDCDYSGITWFPHTGKIVRACGQETDAPADPGARTVLLKPQGGDLALLHRLQKGIHLSACYKPVAALTEWYQYELYSSGPYLLKHDGNGDVIQTYEATGPAHMMLSGEATPSPVLHFITDYAFSVPNQNAEAAVAFINDYLRERHLSLPIGAVYMRFSPSDDASLMAHSSAGGDFNLNQPALNLEFLVYRPKGFDDAQNAEFTATYDNLASELMSRFSARPHWGKSKQSLFKEAVAKGLYGDNLEAFKAVAVKLDPAGIFSNDWAEDIGLR
ncbi:FAD-binding protein [Hahella ganghwensis]|uniref:FAD-binding protein n=1 Tax=Hahella ganghwensis TaxID=286420 RepID=UPI000377D2BA|nr:FAD-binding protein [Hahella ganghwensis]